MSSKEVAWDYPSAKKIIERHNGHIRAEAKPGAGARFLVDLPIVDTKTSASEMKPEKINFG